MTSGAEQDACGNGSGACRVASEIPEIVDAVEGVKWRGKVSGHCALSLTRPRRQSERQIHSLTGLAAPISRPMQSFAALLERLLLTPSRNGKLALIQRYLADTPDPARGWALAAITGDLSIPSVKPAMIR